MNLSSKKSCQDYVSNFIYYNFLLLYETGILLVQVGICYYTSTLLTLNIISLDLSNKIPSFVNCFVCLPLRCLQDKQYKDIRSQNSIGPILNN